MKKYLEYLNVRLIVLIFATSLLMMHSMSLTGRKKIRFERIASENYILHKGLSQNSIYSIYQDTKGYMWFGTRDNTNIPSIVITRLDILDQQYPYEINIEPSVNTV